MLKRILVVDDDPDLRRTVRAVLKGIGEVFEAANGTEAVWLMILEPDLVLLDLSMPGMGGLTALREVKRARSRVPVLILTSERDLDAAKRTLDLGASAYITKPFDVQFLRDEARRLLSVPGKAADDGRPWRVSS